MFCSMAYLINPYDLYIKQEILLNVFVNGDDIEQLQRQDT